MYSIQLIQEHQQTTAEWAGGLTTQLAIYPADADYAKRNFKWRISSALVELETSVFTPLPEIDRLIMVIEGEMTLDHEEHHCAHLQPYEQDRFDGGWTTQSHGKVRDFNLMLAKGCDGSLEAIEIAPAGIHETAAMMYADAEKSTEAFYCVKGPVSFEMEGQRVADVRDGDLLLLTKEHSAENATVQISNKAGSEAVLIHASVIY